ncbi:MULTISPECIES: ATP-binding cassette domain-containing protein [unclassified Oceanispirochaeta]|uniref:ATP-binding cassette domain-containing protein n=1 Tax=unclassified Oceanispirochaeta TaxID=2635722 RepID=UPI000E094F59|nr:MULTISPECIES: ATP-binding cassette domain-containing protein [unclassified Oceanispirochaeta]MBF9018119.1 ATP-binding cassette domain-containing protein [Oceanispirochaeta sp. M2]NPD74583.1 ATP-binding cassette domain-containing protein [Oceanispirochaeta sp. M1]RDG29535.1 ATP-binding cassette domain-containing protein [Oceanispirochaeta sp. M1]
MITKERLQHRTIEEILTDYPFADSFFKNNTLETEGAAELDWAGYFDRFDEEEMEDRALDSEQLLMQLTEFINQMLEFLDEGQQVHSLTILPGLDKSGNPEGFDELVIRKSEVISIVGPTGSGKSRLLGDIEWVARKDTPTKREILINDEIPDSSWRFSGAKKLVAQLSQNMNFVMDLTAEEFVDLHAESRMVENRPEVVERIIEEANKLAGEKFQPDTPITSLSGGQSRALMIADTAILSQSPIILIDEIENAGIDRKKALSLLLSEEKIVLMATHDPVLALMGDRRIVIKNGGISKVIETTDEERTILGRLEELDRTLLSYRTRLRQGESLLD